MTQAHTNPYPSISGTHNGTIVPYVTIYNVSKLYTYPCGGTGGHTEYVAFYYPNGTKIKEGHWEGYASDWHNISFPAFTMHANHTYYYTIKTGSYPCCTDTILRIATSQNESENRLHFIPISIAW